MHTLFRLILLGAFAAAGTALAVAVALNTAPLRLASPESAGPDRSDPSDAVGWPPSSAQAPPPALSDSVALPSAAPRVEILPAQPQLPAPLPPPPLPEPEAAVPEAPEPQALPARPLLQPAIDPVPALPQPAVSSHIEQIRQLKDTLQQFREVVEHNQQLVAETRTALQQSTSRPQATAAVPDAGPIDTPPTGNQPQGELLPPPKSAEPAQTKIHQAEGDEGLTINIQNAEIREVLEVLSEQGGMNILASPSVRGTVSASLKDVDLETALKVILTSTGYEARHDGKFIYVGTAEELQAIVRSRDRINTRVYRPNYVTAKELQALIVPVLTEGVGDASVGASRLGVSSPSKTGIQSDAQDAGGDDFAGGDVLLVRDYETVLYQVDQIVAEVDRRPRQVVIEAMIMSVRLDDTNSLGVNFELLRNKDNTRLIINTPLLDLANIDIRDGGLKFGFLDSSLSVFIEALETIGDTNVIANPRVMCLNKQRAEILIGSQLGYVSTTVTENAATQAIEFLEVGTQLRLRPFITDDGMIRLEVHPELSTGSVKIEEGFTLPDKDVTQVTTNILCRDGCTVIIGGLIREDLTTTRNQVPLFGSLPIVGPAFQQNREEMERREIIVLLTPRIITEPMMCQEGAEAGYAFNDRQDTYKDKMSCIGKRFYGRRYLRLARAAWNAGDARAALKYVNLSVHFNPLDLQAINLRREIVTVSGEGDYTIDSHLRVGLLPAQYPLRDYSKRGFPWKEPEGLAEIVEPAEVYDPGSPGRSRDLIPLENERPQ